MPTGAMHRHLCVSVLIVLCACTCVAVAGKHRCIYDRLAKSPGQAPQRVVVKPEAPAVGRDGWKAFSTAASGWAPIRIAIFTPDMEDPNKYCTKKGEKRPDFSGETRTCTARDVFTAGKRSTIVQRLLPAAVQLHRDRLLVKPLSGNIVVPKFPSDSICAEFTIPKNHLTTGVSGADMVLYAAAGPTEDTTLAWAMSCAQNAGDERSIIGVMNFGPHSVEDTNAAIRVSAHEIAHALGFDYDTFKDKKIAFGGHKVRGKTGVILVTSKKTVEKTREHFGCPTAAGMELEDEGGEGTAESHWERRNAKDELMAGISDLGVYSALTMAAFEDLGYYKANWGMEETMAWGRHKGCDLLTKPCVSGGKTDFPDMFCTSKELTMTCASDRRSLGTCTLAKQTKTLPSHYQYFKDPKLSGSDEDDLMDFCPYIVPFGSTYCANGVASTMPGSLVGPNSRCLKGKDLTVDSQAVGDICADVSCEKKGTVRVRYLGDSTWHTCTDGKAIKPSATFSGGEIVCPRYEEVCVA